MTPCLGWSGGTASDGELHGGGSELSAITETTARGCNRWWGEGENEEELTAVKGSNSV